MSILFKGNLKEGDYKLIKTTNGWVLDGEIAYVGIDRPQGEWIDKCGNKVCACSNCGEEYDHTYEWIEKWDYCPNCGARMDKGNK